MIEPEMESAREAVADLTSDIDDVLIYALYPQTGERFLRIKHGVEQPPVEEQTSAAPPVESQPAASAPPRSSRARRFNVYVGNQFFEVDVDPVGAETDAAPAVRVGSSAPSAPTSTAPQQGTESAEGQVQVTAPMPGILVSLAVDVGEQVSEGQPLLVLEAMKMQNTIPSPSSGTVSSLPVAPGVQVTRNQVLAVIQP